MSKARVFIFLTVLGLIVSIVGGGPRVAHAVISDQAHSGGRPGFRMEFGDKGADGSISGGYKQITGLESEVEVIEYKDGDDLITHKRPGRNKYQNIVLRRGYVSDDPYFSRWFKTILAGKTERKSGSIIILDNDGAEILRYNFFEAWPCRHALIPTTNPTTGAPQLIEELEFAVEKLERA